LCKSRQTQIAPRDASSKTTHHVAAGMIEGERTVATPRFRYGLRALLLVLLILAAIAGAYRYGYLQGRADGPVIPTSLDFHRIYLREYDVSDLVSSPSGQINADGLTKLRNHLTTWAAPDSWDLVGGYGIVRPGKEGTSIVVEHSFPGHAAVLEQLTRIRFQRKFAPRKELSQALEDVETVLRAEAAARKRR
jgi:hypothetical protein